MERKPFDAVVVVGDALARQDHDPVGLLPRLSGRLERAVVTGAPTGGNVWNIVDDASWRAFTMSASVAQGTVVRGTVVAVVGAEASKAGGPPPAAFVACMRLLTWNLALLGWRSLIVLAPPCPAGVASLPGYAKGSRRWLRRIEAPLLDLVGAENERIKWFKDPPVRLVRPAIADDQWESQLALKPAGIDAMADAIAAALAEM